MRNEKDEKKVMARSIRGRLIIGFSVISFVLVAAIILVLIRVSSMEKFAEKVINIDLPSHDLAYELQVNIYLSHASLSNWLLTHDPDYKTTNIMARKNIARVTKDLDVISVEWTNKVNDSQWQSIKTLVAELDVLQNKILDTPNVDNQIVTTEVRPLVFKILDLMEGPLNSEGQRVGGLFDMQTTELTNNTHLLMSDMNIIRYIEYTLLAVCIVLSILITLSTIKGIVSYINIFRDYSGLVASGDLTQRIQVGSHDEMGQLGMDLNAMTESLATITKQITDACHQMVTTIAEVKHAVDVQSSGATEQSSSINEITSSLEEIEKSSTQTIEKAKTLGNVAERTREKGQMGLDAVEQSINGMKAVRDRVETIAQTILELSNQTQQVGEITAVVNALAQQSKMLALNASIEAAKAGEAGKGFAVVAAEVKNLAEQSEQSTTQVQKILEDIRHATEKAVMATEEGTKGVDLGTGLVEQTGEVVRSLTDVIYETTVASQQIEAAIRQEGIGIEQITAGMNEINQVTGSFVDSVKQTTEAIEHLGSMVKNLKEYIDVYKV